MKAWQFFCRSFTINVKMIFTATLFFTFVILASVTYYLKNSRFYKAIAKFSGPPELPLLGNSHLFIGDNERELIVFRFWTKLNILVLLLLNLSEFLFSRYFQDYYGYHDQVPIASKNFLWA